MGFVISVQTILITYLLLLKLPERQPNLVDLFSTFVGLKIMTNIMANLSLECRFQLLLEVPRFEIL